MPLLSLTALDGVGGAPLMALDGGEGLTPCSSSPTLKAYSMVALDGRHGRGGLTSCSTAAAPGCWMVWAWSSMAMHLGWGKGGHHASGTVLGGP